MPWCPKCGYEYVDGIKVCPDCNVQLQKKRNVHREQKKKTNKNTSHIDEIVEWQDHQNDVGYWVSRGKIPSPGNKKNAAKLYYFFAILLSLLLIFLLTVGEMFAILLIGPVIIFCIAVGKGYNRQNKRKK